MSRQLKVFLSSPGDVAEERKAAMDLFERLKDDPVFEQRNITIKVIAWDQKGCAPPMHAGRPAQDTIDRYLSRPAECDVVIFIFWSRIGTPLPPQFTTTDDNHGLSGTQWEYENAITGFPEKNSPEILVYRRMQKVELSPDDPDLHEKCNQLTLLKNFLDSFPRYAPKPYEYQDVSDFKEKLGEDLRKLVVKLTEKERREDSTHARRRVCHSLPARDYGELLGRENDITRVINALRSETPVISIEGFNGVGKTSLAVEVGYLCLPRSDRSEGNTVTFDYIVWISAKDKPKQQYWLDDVLNRTARRTDYSVISEMTEGQEKLDKMDELLREKRVLLIIDNFETINDRTLINWIERMPPPSKVLITTRRKGLCMSQPVDLAGLPPAEALKLIRKHADAWGLHSVTTRSDEELMPLVENTGGNPEAIKLSLGGIRGGTLNLEQVIDGLQAHYRNRDIDEVFRHLFSKSWSLLTENAQRVLMMVPLFVGASSIPQDALREASGLTRDGFDRALKRLVEFNLLQMDFTRSSGKADYGLPRYIAHPMTLTFSRLKLEQRPAFEEEARERWAKYFLRFVKNHIVRPAPDVSYWNALVSDQMDMIDSEWSSIHEVLRWADKQHKDQLLLDLVMLVVHYMDSRFLNLERVKYIKKGIRIASAMGHKEEEALLRIDALAWTYIEEGRLKAAYAQIMRGREIVVDHRPEIQTATDLMALSFAWRARVRIEEGKWEEANRFIYHAFAAKCSPWITSRVNMAAGDIALKQNRWRDALRLYEKTAKTIETYGGEGHGYQIDPRIGLAHLAVGNLDEAKKRFNALGANEAIPIGKLYGDYGLAMVAYNENRREEARQLAAKTQKALSRRKSSNLLLKLTNQLFQDLEAARVASEIENRDRMSALHKTQSSGVEVITLERPKLSGSTDHPVFVRTQILPNRGMMVLQITAYLPGLGETDLLYAPSSDEACESFGGEDDFMGNKSFAFGGAILLPFANRIRGKLSADGTGIETTILGKKVHLHANGGGKEPGAEQYALHGLILNSHVSDINKTSTIQEDKITANLRAGDFGGHWLSATDVSFKIVLRSESFILSVTAKNVGTETLPIGIGWHPYFIVLSRKREQARLLIPSRKRVLVNNYDEVLPTGKLVPVAGTSYDFSMPNGKPIGDLFLDDCFVDLEKTAEGHTVAEIVDAEASYGLRLVATSPEVSAIQVYSLPSEPYIVVEPQFNWADPYGAQWAGKTDTGMVILEPGEEVVYSARLELFTLC